METWGILVGENGVTAGQTSLGSLGCTQTSKTAPSLVLEEELMPKALHK